jgi:hypothetical protein
MSATSGAATHRGVPASGRRPGRAEGQGTQAAELAAIFSKAALTGQPDFPSDRA